MLAEACLELATKVATVAIHPCKTEGRGAGSNSSGDQQKPLDVLADELLLAALRRCPAVGVVASEEQDQALVFGDGPLCVAIDPLDGSRNIEASMPTGVIFCIFHRLGNSDSSQEMLQQADGKRILASGYCLFSSATVFVLGLRGAGVRSWCRVQGEESSWHDTGYLHMPARGQIYSLNDARYFDWPQGLRRYIDDVRCGRGATGKKYSARYVCCLVADFHRTLLDGGWCGNPRPHLRVLFECLPLAFIAVEAGGLATDGLRRYLSEGPPHVTSLHQRAPLFVGSAEDIRELESYGDVQQLGGEKYSV